jgi:integrase
LADVDVDAVAGLVSKMTRDGYAAWTVRGSLVALGRIYATAVRRGLVVTNPVRQLERGERPKADTVERRIPTEDELQRLLAKAGKRTRPMIAVAALSGLRLGELLGLRWGDVDFDGGFLHVRRQLGRDRLPVDLKSARARRDVVLVPQLAKVLREAKMASPHKAAGDYVFPGMDGRGRDHRGAARGFERAATAAKLEGLSFHSLRHFFASLLVNGLGADVETVSRQLGHADATTTLRTYSHEFAKARNAEKLRNDLGARVGSLLGGASS